MQELDPRIKNALISINPTAENPAWHGAPTAIGILRGVNSRVAVWRPYQDASNIREISLHIAYWENSVANRLSGKREKVEFKQRKTSWPLKLDRIDDKHWKDEIAIIKAIHQRLTKAVINFDPDLLDQPYGSRESRNAIEYIHGVAEHRLYHTAQIKMIKVLAKHQGIT